MGNHGGLGPRPSYALATYDQTPHPATAEPHASHRATTPRGVTTEHKWQRDGIPPLSYEEFLAGEACRGCGALLVDDRGPRPATLHLTEETRPFWEAEDTRFEALHPDCHAGRWTLSPGGPAHCNDCCPPPPMSPEQVRRIASLLRDPPTALPARPIPEPAKRSESADSITPRPHDTTLVRSRSPERFAVGVAEHLGYYVYLLSDPRTSRPFYVGKGVGDRCFAHLREARRTQADTVGDYAKLATIRAIEQAGLTVTIEVLRHGLTEPEAFAVEAAAIDLLGMTLPPSGLQRSRSERSRWLLLLRRRQVRTQRR